MNKELLRGHVDLLILAVLEEDSSYGYEISKRIKLRSEIDFELQEGTLYLALKRLEKLGFLESFWGSESSGGKRKYYQTTDEGKIHLKKLRNDFKKLQTIIVKFMEE